MGVMVTAFDPSSAPGIHTMPAALVFSSVHASGAVPSYLIAKAAGCTTLAVAFASDPLLRTRCATIEPMSPAIVTLFAFCRSRYVCTLIIGIVFDGPNGITDVTTFAPVARHTRFDPGGVTI